MMLACPRPLMLTMLVAGALPERTQVADAHDARLPAPPLKKTGG